MVQQLLWIEILLKGTTGLILLIAPCLFAKSLGLPAIGAPFWPRLVGSLLCGLAGAVILTAWLGRSNATGLAGLAAMNVTVGVIIIAQLAVGSDPLPRRGRVLLWMAAIILCTLSAVEIAWA